MFRLIKKLFHLPVVLKKEVEAVTVKSIAVKNIFAVISFNIKIQNLKQSPLKVSVKKKNIFLMNECTCYLARIFYEPRDVLREEMEDNPAVDSADEVPRPQSGLTGGGFLPHTDHTDPEARLLSPGRHPGHDGSPLLQVPAPRAGEAPG